MTTLPWEKLNASYDVFMGTCSIKSGNGVFQSSQTLKMMNNQKGRRNSIRRSRFTNLSYHGTSQRLQLRPEKLTEAERLPGKHSSFSRRISDSQSKRFTGQLQHHVASLNQSGSISSRERQSTLMLSSAISTTLPLLRRMWATLEEEKSLLERQIQLKRCK